MEKRKDYGDQLEIYINTTKRKMKKKKNDKKKEKRRNEEIKNIFLFLFTIFAFISFILLINHNLPNNFLLNQVSK